LNRSGYVLAGFETLASIVDNYILGKKGRYDNNFTRADISNFLASTCHGFLHSFGQNFPNKKKYEKYKKSEAEVYTKCRDMGVFDDCTLLADSGGFQISIGRLTRRESDLLYKLYYEWIEEYYDVYDRAFILDVPPGPGCEIFHSFDDVFKLNLESYLKAKSLPYNVRQKIIYIHHFRTPKLWEIYTKILREYEMFDSFSYHGTGGIVANMSSDMSIPCIIYVLPLIPLLNECKKYNRKTLNFHILGGANFRDILFYELFKITVKDHHDIDLNITYDSSGIYKQVMNARYLLVQGKFGNIKKMDIRRVKLNTRFDDSSKTVTEIYEEILNKMAERWNFKKISIDGIYDPNTDTFYEDVKIYSLLYTLELFPIVQNMMKEFAKIAYELYMADEKYDFLRLCENQTRLINQGKLTRKQIIKTKSILVSLDMLVNLDEERCKNIVDHKLDKDEFRDLHEKTRVLHI